MDANNLLTVSTEGMVPASGCSIGGRFKGPTLIEEGRIELLVCG